MSNQPRPWFRTFSIARPTTAPTPTPAREPPPPQPPQPRPFLRPAFRPIGQPQPPPPPPQQPQEPAPPSPPPAGPAPPPPGRNGAASVPASPTPRPPAPSASVPTSPARPTVPSQPTISSVPSSPAKKQAPTSPARPTVPSQPTISSVPSSPAKKQAPTSPARPSVVTQPPVTTSVPSPPKPTALSQPTISSVPSSPAKKQAPTSTSVPSSPKPKPAPYSSVPTSPSTKPVPTVSSVRTSPEFKPVIVTTRTESTAPSPRGVKPVDQSPARSPKFKPQAPPPSPLILPPAQIRADAEPEPRIPFLEAEKTVVVQKTTETAKTWSNGMEHAETKQVPQVLNKQGPIMVRGTKEKGQSKKISSDSDDGTRIITIAGENKGATMEIFHSPKKNAFVGNPHTLSKKGTERRVWDSSGSKSSSDEEKSRKIKDKSDNGMMNSPPMHAFMNSNVQAVNNSIVFKSECSHHDPGVHLSLYRKPGVPIKDRMNIGPQS